VDIANGLRYALLYAERDREERRMMRDSVDERYLTP